MNREMEFIRKFSLAYAAACKPLCQELVDRVVDVIQSTGHAV